MAYTLRALCIAKIDAVETVDGTTSPGSGEGGNARTYDQYGQSVNLHGSTGSYPEIGGQAADLSHTLSGGTTKDFDLTAVPWCGDVSKTFSASGKKLVGIEIQMNKGNNAAGVSLGPQGANGYDLFGAGNSLKLFPGAQCVLFYADPLQASLTLNTPAVGAGEKDVRFTGTDLDAWKCKAIFSE